MVTTVSLAVRNLSYVYESSGRGCHDVTFHADAGEMVALVGPSGCGKSTALACIAGVLTARGGNVEVSGSNPQRVSLAMQAAPLFEGLRLWENVAIAWGYPTQRSRADALNELAAVGLEDYSDALPATLSVGQRQRGAVAAALAQHCDVLLFDEPTGSLDDRNAGRVLQALRVAADRGRIVILATHDSRVISHVDRVAELKERES